MGDPITYALDQIEKRKIPKKILELAFKRKYSMFEFPTSLNELITNTVIRPIVLVDTNLVGGIEMNIPLTSPPIYQDLRSIVFKIPPENRQDKNIISVLSVGKIPMQTYGGGAVSPVTPLLMGSTSALTNQAIKMSNASNVIPSISDANVELIGDNTILVKDQYYNVNIYTAKCLLENDSNLNNLKPSAWPSFLLLCELAVKSYIYNELIIAIDESYLQQGQELGIVKTIIESYSDASQAYDEYLKTIWSPTMFSNDGTTSLKFIRLALPGNI